MPDAPNAARLLRRSARDAAALAFVVSATAATWVRFASPGAEERVYAFFRFTSDYFNYYIPMTEAAGARLRVGELPLWNPEGCSGMPFLATLQTAVLYPPTWLAAFVPAHRLLPWLGVAQCVLGGVFAYALFRAGSCERPASAAGGLLFAFTCCVGQTLWPPTVATICWVPWLLLAVEKIARGGGVRWWVGLALGAALQVLAGFPQFLLYGYAIVAPYAALRVATHGDRSAAAAARRLLAIGSAIALGFGLASVQLLPALELVQQSSRAEELGVSQVHYLHPSWRFVSSAQVLANALDPTPGRLAFGERGSGYLGSASLLFLGVALFARRREPLLWLLVGLAGVSLLLSDGFLGGWPGLYSAFSEVPIVGRLRTPERLRVIYALCVVAIATLGFSSLLRAAAEARRRGATTGVLLGTFAVLAGLALLLHGPSALPRSVTVLGVALALCLATLWSGRAGWRTAFGWALVGLLAVDVVTATEPRAPLRDIPDDWVGRFRKGRAVLGEQQLAAFRAAAGDGRLLLAPLLPFTGGGATGGIRRISCYEPLTPMPWSAVAEELGIARGGADAAKALDEPAGLALQDLTSVRGRVVPAGESFRLEKNPDALPRAYWLGTTRVAGSAETIAALTAGTLRPRAETRVERELSVGGPAAPGTAEARGPVPARLLVDEPEAVVLEVDAPRAGLLILTDTAYPGWEATVDGEPASVERANGVHRAVVVGPGRHRVTFRYRPASLRVGAGISVVSLLVLLAVAALPFLRARR